MSSKICGLKNCTWNVYGPKGNRGPLKSTSLHLKISLIRSKFRNANSKPNSCAKEESTMSTKNWGLKKFYFDCNGPNGTVGHTNTHMEPNSSANNESAIKNKAQTWAWAQLRKYSEWLMSKRGKYKFAIKSTVKFHKSPNKWKI